MTCYSRITASCYTIDAQQHLDVPIGKELRLWPSGLVATLTVCDLYAPITWPGG